MSWYQDCQFNMKMDIVIYDGQSHEEDFLNWIYNIKNFFDYLEIYDD